MASHVVRNTLIVTGVVLLLVQGALVVCWWKLPEWAPRWTVTHSPFLDPALRAAEIGGTEIAGAFEERLLDWGPEIAAELRRRFAHADARAVVMQLANALARRDGIRPGTVFAQDDEPGWSAAEVAVVRDDLVALGLAALAEGSGFLPMSAAYLVMPLRDPRTVEPFAAFLLGRPTPLDEDFVPIVRLLGMLSDHRAVPALTSVLPIRHKPHPAVEEALESCANAQALPAVIAATAHPHAVVRQWAVLRYILLPRSEDFDRRVVALLSDPERQVCLAAIDVAKVAAVHAAVPALLTVARQRDDHATQLAAIAALAAFPGPQTADVLLELAGDQEDDVAHRARTALQRFPLDADRQARLRAIVPEAPTSPAAPPAP